jgi:hypothetical protein
MHGRLAVANKWQEGGRGGSAAACTAQGCKHAAQETASAQQERAVNAGRAPPQHRQKKCTAQADSRPGASTAPKRAGPHLSVLFWVSCMKSVDMQMTLPFSHLRVWSPTYSSNRHRALLIQGQCAALAFFSLDAWLRCLYCLACSRGGCRCSSAMPFHNTHLHPNPPTHSTPLCFCTCHLGMSTPP